MSHDVQLSPAASHCPTAVLDPAGHAAEPPACRSRWPYSPAGHASDTVPPWKSDLHGHLSHPRQRFPGEQGTGTAGPVRAVLPLSAARPIPAKREAARGHRGQLARAGLRAEPSGSDLPARLMTAIDLRAPPQVPAIDLPVDLRRPPGAGQPQRPRRRIRFCRIEHVAPMHACAQNSQLCIGWDDPWPGLEG